MSYILFKNEDRESSDLIEINIDTCDTLCNEIDKLRIMTVLSERPPTPNWLKPTKIITCRK